MWWCAICSILLRPNYRKTFKDARCYDERLSYCFFMIVTYDDFVIIVGYIQNGEFSKAIDLYQTIRNTDDVIHLLFFNACAQVGSKDLLETVKRASSKVSHALGINNSLTTSLIDALMKCGDVLSAEIYFDQISTKNTHLFNAMMKGDYMHCRLKLLLVWILFLLYRTHHTRATKEGHRSFSSSQRSWWSDFHSSFQRLCPSCQRRGTKPGQNKFVQFTVIVDVKCSPSKFSHRCPDQMWRLWYGRNILWENSKIGY